MCKSIQRLFDVQSAQTKQDIMLFSWISCLLFMSSKDPMPQTLENTGSAPTQRDKNLGIFTLSLELLYMYGFIALFLIFRLVFAFSTGAVECQLFLPIY